MFAENIVISFSDSQLTPEADYSIKNPGTSEFIKYMLVLNGIVPQTHPKIVDVFSGEQGELRTFIKAGWRPENITCFDLNLPQGQRPAKTLTWDLSALYKALEGKEKLPKAVIEHKGKYDIFLAFFAAKFEPLIFSQGRIYQGFHGADFLATLAEFFCKKGGIAYLDGHRIKPELSKLKKWEEVGDNSFYHLA